MSRIEKLIQRLLALPKDLTWEELVKILAQFGYIELKKGKTGGSRRKFADEKKNIITLHTSSREYCERICAQTSDHALKRKRTYKR